MRYLTIIFLGLLNFIGCKNSPLNTTTDTYFGGEIVNPKSDTVILYGLDGVSNDTLYIDENNRFLQKFTDIEAGVYTFRHGGEIQFIILEPKDSIMIRLNTYDFDESLVFNGKGAHKNNYLIKTFLSNEKKAQNLVSYSQKDPETFEAFITKRHNNELKEFEKFKENKSISSFANTVIKANIDYHNYADKEIYPFAYFGENKMVHIKDLPEDFYAFRNNINYNASELGDIFAYNRFLFFHFDNLGLTDYYSKNEYHSKFNRHQLAYNKAKLNLVDSLVKNERIKNSLLKYKTREFISNCNNKKEIDDIMAVYLSKTTNEDDIKYMNGLVASLDNLMPGKGLPDLEVITVNQKEYKISELVDRPTLIYFWSSNIKKHYKNSHYRVKELKQKFPDIKFMSININDTPDKYWKETINNYKFDLNNEYRFKNPKDALETLAVNYLYKVIIVDKEANIIHPNVNIFNDDFETTLSELLKVKKPVL